MKRGGHREGRELDTWEEEKKHVNEKVEKKKRLPNELNSFLQNTLSMFDQINDKHVFYKIIENIYMYIQILKRENKFNSLIIKYNTKWEQYETGNERFQIFANIVDMLNSFNITDLLIKSNFEPILLETLFSFYMDFQLVEIKNIYGVILELIEIMIEVCAMNNNQKNACQEEFIKDIFSTLNLQYVTEQNIKKLWIYINTHVEFCFKTINHFLKILLKYVDDIYNYFFTLTEENENMFKDMIIIQKLEGYKLTSYSQLSYTNVKPYLEYDHRTGPEVNEWLTHMCCTVPTSNNAKFKKLCQNEINEINERNGRNGRNERNDEENLYFQNIDGDTSKHFNDGRSSYENYRKQLMMLREQNKLKSPMVKNYNMKWDPLSFTRPKEKISPYIKSSPNKFNFNENGYKLKEGKSNFYYDSGSASGSVSAYTSDSDCDWSEPIFLTKCKNYMVGVNKSHLLPKKEKQGRIKQLQFLTQIKQNVVYLHLLKHIVCITFKANKILEKIDTNVTKNSSYFIHKRFNDIIMTVYKKKTVLFIDNCLSAILYSLNPLVSYYSEHIENKAKEAKLFFKNFNNIIDHIAIYIHNKKVFYKFYFDRIIKRPISYDNKIIHNYDNIYLALLELFSTLMQGVNELNNELFLFFCCLTLNDEKFEPTSEWQKYSRDTEKQKNGEQEKEKEKTTTIASRLNINNEFLNYWKREMRTKNINKTIILFIFISKIVTKYFSFFKYTLYYIWNKVKNRKRKKKK